MKMGRIPRAWITRFMGLWLLAAVMVLSMVSPVAATPEDLEGLEPFLAGIVMSQLDQGNVTGATVSVVKDGEIVLAQGYGYADREARTPVDPERTLFSTGSTSKLLTWTAVMQLVEQEVLDLDADVNEYLDFAVPDTIRGEGGSGEAAPITLRHLMTHTPVLDPGGPGALHAVYLGGPGVGLDYALRQPDLSGDLLGPPGAGRVDTAIAGVRSAAPCLPAVRQAPSASILRIRGTSRKGTGPSTSWPLPLPAR